MPRFHISRQAKRDLDAIWDQVARRDGIGRAEHVLDLIGATIRLSGDMPGGGSDRGALGVGLRSYASDNYLVFFRRTRRGVEIARVIHGARRLERVFRRARRPPDGT